MGRPVGSKNKKKLTAAELKVQEEINAVAPEVIPAPVVPRGKGCAEAECGHERKIHYGGVNDWCNQSGCRCGAWQE